MTTQRVYICPVHPAKPYTSWRKFRGHWSTQHRGEECPPREEFRQEMEKEEVKEAKTEAKEELKEAAKERKESEADVLDGDFSLPEEPAPRLMKILQINEVPEDVVRQIMGAFQLLPQFRDNPTNLHYLLTAKLPRKFHSSIPLMTAAFMTQGDSYPEGIPIMGSHGMGGANLMPPFGFGGGGNPFYPPTFGYYPYPNRPIRERAEEREEREPARKEDPMSSMKDMFAMMGIMMEFVAGLKGKDETDATKLSEDLRTSYEALRDTLEKVVDSSRADKEALVDKFTTQLEKVREESRNVIEATKEQLHATEKAALEQKIEALQESKDEERSEGLGSLLKEAGEGIGAQVDGVRSGITEVGKQITEVVKTVVSVPGVIGKAVTSPTAPRTITDANAIAKAEQEVEELAQSLQGGG